MFRYRSDKITLIEEEHEELGFDRQLRTLTFSNTLVGQNILLDNFQFSRYGSPLQHVTEILTFSRKLYIHI